MKAQQQLETPTPAQPERLSEDEMRFLRDARTKFEQAQFYLNSALQVVAEKHQLQPTDKVNDTTGLITRTAPVLEATPCAE